MGTGLRWEAVPYRRNEVDCFADLPQGGRVSIRKRKYYDQYTLAHNGNFSKAYPSLKEAKQAAEETVWPSSRGLSSMQPIPATTIPPIGSKHGDLCARLEALAAQHDVEASHAVLWDYRSRHVQAAKDIRAAIERLKS